MRWSRGTSVASDNSLVSIGAGLRGPAGLTAAVYANGLTHASAFANDFEGRLSVVSFLPDGSDLRVDASGIRAAVGLTYYPGTSDLFVAMNQRDDLGDLTPGDWQSGTIYRITASTWYRSSERPRAGFSAGCTQDVNAAAEKKEGASAGEFSNLCCCMGVQRPPSSRENEGGSPSHHNRTAPSRLPASLLLYAHAVCTQQQRTTSRMAAEHARLQNGPGEPGVDNSVLAALDGSDAALQCCVVPPQCGVVGSMYRLFERSESPPTGGRM